MQKTKLIKKLSAFLCIVLIAAIALFVTGCKDNKTNVTSTPVQEGSAQQNASGDIVLGEGATTFNFSIVDKDGTETNFVIKTDQKTVCDALLELNMIDGDIGPYGLYVKTVNGITVDFDKDGKYWAFYVDGKYATSGVDHTSITPGAIYSFKVE